MTPSTAVRVKTLLIHTHDASRSLKPSSYGALSHAVHETLHFALDGAEEDWAIRSEQDRAPCGPGQEGGPTTIAATPQDAAAAAAAVVSNGATSSSRNDDDEPKPRPGFSAPKDATDQRSYISYALSSAGQLSIPHPNAIAAGAARVVDPCAAPNRDNLDVTAKFFCLAPPSKLDAERGAADWVEDALKTLASSTGYLTVDRAILEFPTLDLESEKGGSEDLDVVRKTWEALSPNPQMRSLGLSSISPANLTSLFPSLPRTQEAQSHSGASTPAPSSPSPAAQVPSAWRAPAVVTIDVASMHAPPAWSQDLKRWCAERGVELATGPDGKEVLPEETLPTLFAEFQDALPVALPSSAKFTPRWCLKYTILIRDRGVIADQSWILLCDVEEAA